MKLLAVIVAIFITVLTIKPTVQLLDSSTLEVCCETSCCVSDDYCSKASNPQQQDTNNCCPGGVCNPFETCNCCCGGIVGRPSITSSVSFIKINYSSVTQNDLVLGFQSDCYQPPESV